MRTTGHLRLKAERIEDAPNQQDDAQFRHLFSTLPYVNRVLESDITTEEIMDIGRHPRVVMARELCTFLMHYVGKLSYPDIAKLMGRKSHGACHAQVDRMLTCWVKTMSGKEMRDLMRRRAMEQ